MCSDGATLHAKGPLVPLGCGPAVFDADRDRTAADFPRVPTLLTLTLTHEANIGQRPANNKTHSRPLLQPGGEPCPIAGPGSGSSSLSRQGSPGLLAHASRRVVGDGLAFRDRHRLTRPAHHLHGLGQRHEQVEADPAGLDRHSRIADETRTQVKP